MARRVDTDCLRLLQGLNPLPIRKIQAVRPGSFY